MRAIAREAELGAGAPHRLARVREEARKADEHTLTWAAEDIKRSEKIWAQNGGKEIHLSPAEQKRFLDESIAAATPILTATPQGKEDYEALAAAAKKYRK